MGDDWRRVGLLSSPSPSPSVEQVMEEEEEEEEEMMEAECAAGFLFIRHLFHFFFYIFSTKKNKKFKGRAAFEHLCDFMVILWIRFQMLINASIIFVFFEKQEVTSGEFCHVTLAA